MKIDLAAHGSEGLLHLIMDMVPAGISYFDSDERFCFANHQYETFTGLSPDDLIGKTLEAAIGAKRYRVAKPYVERVLKGESVRYENTLSSKDGGSVTIAVSYTPNVGPNGTILGFFSLVGDITEHKLAEKALKNDRDELESRVEERTRELLETNKRLVQEIADRKQAEATQLESNAQADLAYTRLTDAIESISQGFALFDADDRLVLCNSRYRRGMQCQMTPGMPFEAIIRNAVASGLIHAAEGNTDVWIASRLAQHRKPNGAHLQQRSSGDWLQVTESRTDEGGVVAVYSDVTKIKNAERELSSANQYLDNQSRELEEMTQHLIESRDQAELANRTKTEFLANMSHELRTPLNAIIGFSDVMQSGLFGPIGSLKYLQYVKDINSSGLHLLGLINDILDLSKIEAGKIELYEENIDVSKVLGSCLTLIKERAEAGGVEIECDDDFDLPALYADERKLKQIMINLLSNAIKFTPGGGKVTIKIWRHSGDGHVFQVTDTGIGIALDDIPKALTPFRQIDSALNRKYDGTGLGLPLSKALAELHDASLDLQSTVGVGTTVTVRFPAERIVSEMASVS